MSLSVLPDNHPIANCTFPLTCHVGSVPLRTHSAGGELFRNVSNAKSEGYSADSNAKTSAKTLQELLQEAADKKLLDKNGTSRMARTTRSSKPKGYAELAIASPKGSPKSSPKANAGPLASQISFGQLLQHAAADDADHPPGAVAAHVSLGQLLQQVSESAGKPSGLSKSFNKASTLSLADDSSSLHRSESDASQRSPGTQSGSPTWSRSGSQKKAWRPGGSTSKENTVQRSQTADAAALDSQAEKLRRSKSSTNGRQQQKTTDVNQSPKSLKTSTLQSGQKVLSAAEMKHAALLKKLQSDVNNKEKMLQILSTMAVEANTVAMEENSRHKAVHER